MEMRINSDIVSRVNRTRVDQKIEKWKRKATVTIIRATVPGCDGRERERERGGRAVVEKGRGDSTPPPVERGCIHRPPCRRGSQSWVSISRGTWWERRNIPGWPILVSPRDSIPPPCVPDPTSERILTDPCQSSPRYQSHSFSHRGGAVAPVPLRPCSIRVAPHLELDDSDRGDRKERMEEGLEGRKFCSKGRTVWRRN